MTGADGDSVVMGSGCSEACHTISVDVIRGGGGPYDIEGCKWPYNECCIPINLNFFISSPTLTPCIRGYTHVPCLKQQTVF